MASGILTLFAVPKAFHGHNAVIQRNAIASWTRLQPACEIILCGDDFGTEQAAQDFGVKYLPDIARNDFRTPLIDSVFEQVEKTAANSLLGYVNADIILLGSFMPAVQSIGFREFLMVGQRWDLDVSEHNTLKQKGAVFGSKFGWERPNWFARPGDTAHDEPSFENKPNWFDAVAEEHRTIRERAALIDQTSFAKFEIAGRGALAALQRIAANDLSGPPGKAVYTQLCNAKGGIEADVTLIHMDDERFLLITGSGFGLHDRLWVEKHLPAGITINDVTNRYATINLCGPQSRAILQSVSDDDLSNPAFPFLAARSIDVGNTSAFAVRIGYVGELGYELYVEQDYAAHVYETLAQAGEDYGIADAGYRAIDSCRMEKGYLYWSGDISPDYNPYEAGLGFCVALDKGDFIGRDALQKIKAQDVARKLVSFTVDGFAPFHGGEAIIHDGKVVGSTTSTGFGHTLGKTIAFGYVPAALAGETSFAIEAFGRSYDAVRGPRCLYDAKMERLKL